MIELGRWQRLKVVRSKEFGVYLSDGSGDGNAVLLPRKQVPADLKAGGEIDVFVYKDSEDRMIATVNTPRITMDAVALLKVVEVSKIGAFMDWGLEKDILLPFKEQSVKVCEGKEYLVRMYKDKSDRLCVSMHKLYELLRTDSGYREGEMVDGVIYDIREGWGAFVAVECCYSAMIPWKECQKRLEIGQRVTARVTAVLDDGKLALSLNKPMKEQMEEDEEKLLKLLSAYDGVLPFTEKASPEVIKRELSISKAAFKRAVGGLYKKRIITIQDGKIRMNKEER